MELSPFTTCRLSPIKYDNPNGYIKLNKRGEEVQVLKKQMKKIYISSDG